MHFIPVLVVMSVILLLRLVSVVMMNHLHKEKPMNKLFRSTLVIASCICETLWAGIVSIAAGAISGHSESFSVLAKHSSSFLEEKPLRIRGGGLTAPNHAVSAFLYN